MEKKSHLFGFLTLSMGVAIAQDQPLPDVPIQAHAEGTEPKPADYHSPGLSPEDGDAVRKIAEDSPGKPQENFGVVSIHDNAPFFQFLGDRLEYRDLDNDEEIVLWDVDLWYGTDYNKLYLESEGEWNTKGETESARVEVFWNHTIRSFWDTQLGIRYDLKPEEERGFLAAGIQGMSPYTFEIDATSYVSEDGDVSFVFEAERDFYLTQRLAIQPRFETEISFSDVPEYNIGSGFTGIEVGLRLRYEISRKFAPYIGVSWERALGETADLIEADGKDKEKVAFVAGLGFWF